jgi:hypothetical protein
LPQKHQRGKQEFKIFCNRNQKNEGRKNDISYRRAHRQPSTRNHLPEQRSKKRKKKAPAQWINKTHRTELPSFSKLGAKTWILEKLNGETCPGSKTENQAEGQKNKRTGTTTGTGSKFFYRRRSRQKPEEEHAATGTVRKLTRALVQQLLPADEVKHNPMKTRESAKTAAATPDRPTSLPKANQKAKRSVQIKEEATFWLQAYERVSSLCLFVCLFVPGEKRYYYCVAHSAMGCHNL